MKNLKLGVEVAVIFLVLVYIGVIVTSWPGFYEHTPEMVALAVIVILAVGWYSPSIAVFLLIAVIATIAVNEYSGRKHDSKNLAYMARRRDYVANPTVWPFLPSAKTGSNKF